MNQFLTAVNNTINWAKEDFTSWPLRFVLEITAWAMSLSVLYGWALRYPIHLF